MEIKINGIDELNKLSKSQKDLMKLMSKERCDDIHSILRCKNYADSIIELEVKIQLLIKLISKT